MEFTLINFQMFRDFIKEKTGMFFKDEKMYYVKSRVETRCKELGCENAEDYYRLLKYDSNEIEIANLVEILTTNETFFFRDIKQLNAFIHEALQLVIEEKRKKGDKKLRIWSAGCSTGEEPYTLGILLSEIVKDMDIQIIATDINSKVIEFAKRGIYNGRSLKDMPAAYLSKYFIKNDQGWKIDKSIEQMIEFQIMNLIDKTRMRLMFNIDFVFCRNVLIYFDSPTAKQIVNYFYDSLNKNGFIFLGLAESMHLLSGAFKVVKFKELLGYMKE